MSPKKRLIQAEDLYRIQTIFDPQISPDGRFIIFTVQWVEQEKEKVYKNLWLIPTGNGRSRQFTYGKQKDHKPRWSPDGRQIAFLSDRDDEDQEQLYLIPVDGGEARPLTDMAGEFGDFAWGPDGKRLVCEFRRKDQEAIEREADETRKELGVVARHITRPRFKFDAEGYLPQERWHLWMIDAGSGKGRPLTDGEMYDERGPVWSPDGATIAFFSNRSPRPDIDTHLVDLYTIPAAGGEMERIETPEGPKYNASFAPDGETIAYLMASAGKGDVWQNTNVWLVSVDGAAPARSLTGHLDLDFTSSTATDTGNRTDQPPTWSPDGQALYAHASRQGAVTLNRITLDGRLTTLVDKGVVGRYSFDEMGEKLAYFYGTVTDLGQVWMRDMENGRSRQCTRFHRWLKQVDLGVIEEVWYQGPDGNALQGWILKPPGFDPGRQYPAILEIHGGPWSQYGYTFMHEFYFLAARGYVVFFTNPRGGAGYGEVHSRAIHRRWGEKDFADLMAWTDYVAGQPYVDAERMGVTGGSYGGYMTGWIVGRTDRFKAAVAQRMVSNNVSFWGSSDVGYFFEDVWSGREPWHDLSTYWRQSPMQAIANVKTPTLVIHSEQDLRCRQEQSEQFFLALQKLGVESELVLFPEESHGLSRDGRTDRRVARLNHILRWFDKYL